jgi:hypothetical protein
MTTEQFSTLMEVIYAVSAVITFGLGYLAGDTA